MKTIDITNIQDLDRLENELFFKSIDCIQFRNELTTRVINAKAKRKISQQRLSDILEISLTKVKQIENGSCVDINAIINYINFLGENLIFI